MKICVINNIYPPYDRGGAEQVVVKTVEGLRAAGHDVVVITSTPERPMVLREDGLTIYRIHPANIFFYTDAHRHSILARLAWHLIDIFQITVAREVRRILAEEKPDVVHTHNLMGLSFLLPRLIRQIGYYHVHTVHDVQLVEPSAMIIKTEEHTWRYRGLPTRIYSALMRFLMGSPSVVISPSHFLLGFYTSRGFFPLSRTVVVRNPVTFSFHESARPSPDSIFRFLYVGQIEEHKGVRLLVDAFMRVNAAQPRGAAELHIVGNGSQLEMIKGVVRQDSAIRVYGRVEREALPGIFTQMDVTVVPSLCYENSPTVIFESFACGVPVIASNIEGIAELIVENENGRTFEAGQQISLEEELRWAIAHRSAVRDMGQHTKTSLSGLGLTAYISRLQEIYTERLIPSASPRIV